MDQKSQEFTHQFYFFQILFTVTGVICWSYYIFLLIKSANNDYRVAFMNFGLVSIGQILGFIMAAIFLGRLGYLRLFRLYNFIQLVVTIITFLTLPHLLDVYLVLAVLRGFGYGFFWLGNNVYNQREVFGLQRGRMLSFLNAIGIVLGIVLPVLAGAAIVLTGYEWIFIITAAVYFVGVIYPWKYNKLPKDTFRPSEIKNFSRKRQFKQWSVFTLILEIVTDQRNIIISILPFLFIGNEFDFGVFTSAMGLLAAVVVLLHRNDEIKRKVKFGYLGAYIVTGFTTFLAFVWNLPALIIRSIAVGFGFAYYSPVETDLTYRVRESLLGNFNQESATEMQVYVESLYTVARVINLIMFMLMFYVLNLNPLQVMQLLLLVGVGRELIFLVYNTHLLDKLRR